MALKKIIPISTLPESAWGPSHYTLLYFKSSCQFDMKNRVIYFLNLHFIAN